MTISGIITAIIIGAIIGALGRLFVRGRQNISIIVTILIGIVAALLGTWIASLFDVKDTGGIDWIELLFQIVLAVIGVSIVAGMGGRKQTTP
ncbi:MULTISPECIES: GlsB/YeaQ/YmgE family stress response membrane protein [unclassified Isoptericola]|uniref:GlsB/YeaQ/YmgE family stress response membrane protein n=1 Tax=unclassified Isoptericola TaxID=2623355 RepID=UPI0035E654DB|nr:GlsB/YeaQ/YmgE family stress response membrane protein [Isoptericola sp. QY 916]